MLLHMCRGPFRKPWSAIRLPPFKLENYVIVLHQYENMPTDRTYSPTFMPDRCNRVGGGWSWKLKVFRAAHSFHRLPAARPKKPTPLSCRRDRASTRFPVCNWQLLISGSEMVGYYNQGKGTYIFAWVHVTTFINKTDSVTSCRCLIHQKYHMPH